MNNLVLKAPLSGNLVPLEEVPDPVFAEKMVGDGIAIDPTSQSLLAPCNGEVEQLHHAGHALVLLTEADARVMLHIGIDTVMLKGEGFVPAVKTGDKVRTGDRLIDFDADYLTAHAPSLMTMIVVTHEMGFAKQAADRIYFFDDGDIVEQNIPDEFFKNPREERTKKFLSQILIH